MVAHILLDDGNQLREVLILHLLALRVEIEPDVVQVGVMQLLVEGGELPSNPLLGTFLVYQVNHVLLAVGLVCLREVFLRGFIRLVEVWLDDDGRCPLHVRFHAPQERD